MFLNLILRIKQLLYFSVVFLLLFPFSFVFASHPIEVKGIRYWSSQDYTRIVIDITEPVEFSNKRVSDPDRLYFDLTHAKIAKEIQTILPIGDGILKTVRAGQFNPDTVRVVLDLEKISDFYAFILDDPARIVIDVYGKEKVKKPDVGIIKRRIVIDAGHGGHDPGAVGFRGIYEKTVVLDIALKLKKILSSDPFNEIILTRETDIFLPLEERTAIANKKDADFFVSVHANASPRRKAKGIETYLLNWTDDEEAMKVAARENAISIKKMKAMNLKMQMDVLDMIKSDLMRQNKRDESIKLAHYIQNSLVTYLDSENNDIVDLGVKSGPFFVLFGARMPSVLVEVSFISNPEEEKMLSNDNYRMQIAKSIAEGLNKYILSLPRVQKVAVSGNSTL